MIEKIECDDGSKSWYLNGRLHREDGPAIERNDGSKFWYLNGRLHRNDGPAVEYADGSKEWWVDGFPHCEDGYAIEWAEKKQWWINGYHIDDIKLYLNKRFNNCIGQFLYSKDKDYLILCFQRDNYYFYTVLWNKYKEEWMGDYAAGKRYDCSLEEIKRLL